MKTRLALLSLFALALPTIPLSAAPPSGSLITGTDHPAVYYLASDGKRYVFPNEKTYFTWYADFSSVVTVTMEELASYPIGGNVTYRPGSRMVKIQSDPRVFVVGEGGALRHVGSEGVAEALYGPYWNTMVDDIPDAFFVNYGVGGPVAVADDFNPSAVRAAASSINVHLGHDSLSMAPRFGDCQIFPDDNPWNMDVTSLSVHPNSDAYVATMGITKHLHPDFDGEVGYGIPFVTVDGDQPKVPITWTAYGDESDDGPYPTPLDAPVEMGSDAHVLTVDTENCILYELYAAEQVGGGWEAQSGAVWDLTSNELRPEGWTSADAAGLPIFPGLIKYEDILDGDLGHAVRFTTSPTQRGYIFPATHYASRNTDPDVPPMGLRMRLKSDFDTSGYGPQARVILEGLKKYGMILADNGSDWYLTGAPDPRWDNDDINDLKSVPASAFEAVYTGEIRN